MLEDPQAADAGRDHGHREQPQRGAVGEVDAQDALRQQAHDAVLPTERVELEDERVQRLGEGQGQHREGKAGGSQAERRHHGRRQARGQHGDEQDQEDRQPLVMEDADGICADAEVRGLAEARDARHADEQVDAHRVQRRHRHRAPEEHRRPAAEDRHDGHDRHQHDDGSDDAPPPGQGSQPLHHGRSARWPKMPCGRIRSTTVIPM